MILGPRRAGIVMDPRGPVRIRRTQSLGSLLPFTDDDAGELAGIGSFLKKIKKAVSIKNVVKVAKKVAPVAALVTPFAPVIGGLAVAKKVSSVVKASGIAKKAVGIAKTAKRVNSFVQKTAPVARLVAPGIVQNVEVVRDSIMAPQRAIEASTPAFEPAGYSPAPASVPVVTIGPVDRAGEPLNVQQPERGSIGGIPPVVLLGAAAAALVLMSKKARQ
ncbi:MAG TPA: hypothetical protein PKI22_08800 [Hydrogenophilus thermoluteolus]|nr:hypothetical protein [Hydrogenophilus thermoluteolus]